MGDTRIGSSSLAEVCTVVFHYLGLLTQWSASPFSVFVMLVLALGALWYLDAVIKVRAKGRSWSGWRIVAFLGGLATIAYALAGPISVYVMGFFTAHVAQHLALMIVGPALLAMSSPITLALQTLPKRRRALLQSFLKSRFLHVVTFPLVVFMLYYVAMWWFFTSSAIGFAMAHMWTMDLLNIAFFLGGVLFWWPLVSRDPILHWRLSYGGKMFSLGIGIPFETFLGIAIASMRNSPTLIYSLGDWHSGGDVLWGAGEFLTTLGLTVVIAQWYVVDTRAAKRMNESKEEVKIASRADPSSMPQEYFWAKQTIARTPPGTPLYEQAEGILRQIAKERSQIARTGETPESTM